MAVSYYMVMGIPRENCGAQKLNFLIDCMQEILQWRRHDLPRPGLKDKIQRLDIQPDKPAQNAYVERFIRTIQHKWLNQRQFESIGHAQETATQWLWPI